MILLVESSNHVRIPLRLQGFDRMQCRQWVAVSASTAVHPAGGFGR
jgi:hypothetical protein